MFGICISKLNLLFFLFVYSYAAHQAVEALHFAAYNKAKYILEFFFSIADMLFTSLCQSILFSYSIYRDHSKRDGACILF